MNIEIRIEKALSARNLRHYFAAIERNMATRGEVVLWPMGKRVYTVGEALAYAAEIAMVAESEE